MTLKRILRPVADPHGMGAGAGVRGAPHIDTAHRDRGQVRSECITCTFRASCCSARLSRAQVPAFADSSVRDRKINGMCGGSKGGRGYRLHWRVQGSTSSPTGIGSRRRVV